MTHVWVCSFSFLLPFCHGSLLFLPSRHGLCSIKPSAEVLKYPLFWLVIVLTKICSSRNKNLFISVLTPQEFFGRSLVPPNWGLVWSGHSNDGMFPLVHSFSVTTSSFICYTWFNSYLGFQSLGSVTFLWTSIRPFDEVNRGEKVEKDGL